MAVERKKLEVNKEGEQLLIVLPELLDYDNVDEVRLECEQALDTKLKQVTVNCKEVKYADSSGLGLLINLHKTVTDLPPLVGQP